ncbi:MAG: O-methyltransferase [Sporomusaceae bacterium]|nr:O-methyltransferase [Sporomusaceae bacterium]
MKHSHLLTELEAYAALQHVPIIQQAGSQVLLDAVRQKQPLRVLEIGTAIGYSTLLIAQEMAAGGTITTIDIDADRQAKARDVIGQANLAVTVEFVYGDALPLIEKLTGPFDFVFIDAAKGHYVHYLQALLTGKLAADALIVADNVLFRGYVMGQEAPPRRFRTIVKRLKAYLELVSNPELFTTEIFPDGDGLAVSRFLGSGTGLGSERKGDTHE